VTAERPEPPGCTYWDGTRYCASTRTRPTIKGYRCREHRPQHAFGYRGGS
jgi:hypothetical protein